MKAIETKYAGYRFRSRLEARYAVFLSRLGIEWRYETEGFELSNGEWYLPDFYLPKFNGGMWVEVKPEDFTEAEKKRCYLLCEGTKQSVWLANGVPDFTCYEVFYWNDQPPYVCEGEGIPLADQAEHENRMYGMSGYGPIAGRVRPEYMHLMGDRLPYAIKEAKEARFEHGETP